MDTTVRQIEASGCRLRPIRKTDARLIVTASRTDVPNWTLLPRDMSEPRARSWISRGMEAMQESRGVLFVIEADHGPAGLVGATQPNVGDRGVVEIFYFVLPALRGRGLATAALLAVADWLEETSARIRRLQLHVIPGNRGSERVAEKAHFRPEGIAVNQIPAVNGFGVRDAIVYGRRCPGEGNERAGRRFRAR